MPLMSAPTLSGIIRRPGGTPARRATRSAVGIKSATTPVELMKEPTAATTSISSAMSRRSSLPARRAIKSPSFCATPVRTSPSPTTKSAAMRITFGSLKPASASSTGTTPSNASNVIMSKATTSIRGLLAANITTVAASRPNTTARS